MTSTVFRDLWICICISLFYDKVAAQWIYLSSPQVYHVFEGNMIKFECNLRPITNVPIVSYKWHQVFSKKEVYCGMAYSPTTLVIHAEKMDDNTHFLCRAETGAEEIVLANYTVSIKSQKDNEQFDPEVIKFSKHHDIDINCDGNNKDRASILKFTSDYKLEDVYYNPTSKRTRSSDLRNTTFMCVNYRKERDTIVRNVKRKYFLVYDPNFTTPGLESNTWVIIIVMCTGGFLAAVIIFVYLLYRRRNKLQTVDQNEMTSRSNFPARSARGTMPMELPISCRPPIKLPESYNAYEEDENIDHNIYDYVDQHLIKPDRIQSNERAPTNVSITQGSGNQTKRYMDMTHNCYVEINK